MTTNSLKTIEKLRAVHAEGNLTVSEIQQQIELRSSLIQQMVGWLYPSMLRTEICELLLLIKDYKVVANEICTTSEIRDGSR